MAEGFARHLAPQGVLVKSGGLKPASQVDPLAIQLMAELGVDISRHEPKDIDLAFARRARRVVVMGCDPEEACPAEILDWVESWDLPNPGGISLEEGRALRDVMERRVAALLQEL